MSYPRCSYKSVRDLLLTWSGQLGTQLTAAQRVQLDGLIYQRLRDWAWIQWWWPDTTVTQPRQYRADYSAFTAYAAPTETSASEVYFPASQTYYQALRATTGNAPATLTGGTYVVNGAYWATCAGPYTGPDWADNTAYAVGDIVRDIVTGFYKQCFIAHTSSGSIDNGKFGILTQFDPYVAKDQAWEGDENIIGDFIGLYLDDPKVIKGARRVPYLVDNLGAHVQFGSLYDGRYAGADIYWGTGGTSAVPYAVYVRYRMPCPVFRGSLYSGASVYTAGVDTVYFEGTTTDLEGDYWECIVTTTAGQSPQTTPASWKRLEFPLWLQTSVARKAFADWLRYGSQREDAMAEDAAAADEIFGEQLRQGGGQAQTMKWRKSS